MTLDGKIATQTGHSAWVTSPEARAVVFETRALSDAVVVGGQTVRRDNPQLTTRREGGHLPARIVLSRTLDLPEVLRWVVVCSAVVFVIVQYKPAQCVVACGLWYNMSAAQAACCHFISHHAAKQWYQIR